MEKLTSPGLAALKWMVLASLFAGCSFYSSAGRKQFEEKAPSQLQAQSQTQAKASGKNGSRPDGEEAPRNGESRFSGEPHLDSEGYLLLGCRHLGATEAWFVEELSKRSSEVLVKTALYEIRGIENAQHEYEVTAVLPLASASNAAEFQSCQYLFPSREAWLSDRAEFLQELLNPNEDLD
jgi:hypothetical protein